MAFRPRQSSKQNECFVVHQEDLNSFSVIVWLPANTSKGNNTKEKK